MKGEKRGGLRKNGRVFIPRFKSHGLFAVYDMQHFVKIRQDCCFVFVMKAMPCKLSVMCTNTDIWLNT